MVSKLFKNYSKINKKKKIEENIKPVEKQVDIIEVIKGRDGKDADEEKIIEEVLKRIPKPQNGKDAIVDYESIIKEVLQKMPKPKDGKDIVIDYGSIIKAVLEKIKIPAPIEKTIIKNEIIEKQDITTEQIIDKIQNYKKEGWLDVKAIKGLSKQLQVVLSGFAGSVSASWGRIRGDITNQTDLIQYINEHSGGGGGTWGSITGTLSDQTDLQNALNNKVTKASASTDNAIARFDGATGDLLQDSKIIVTDNGSTTLTPSSNSTSTFLVNNSAGSAILNVDTTNTRLGIGTNAPERPLHLQLPTTASGTAAYLKHTSPEENIFFAFEGTRASSTRAQRFQFGNAIGDSLVFGYSTSGGSRWGGNAITLNPNTGNTYNFNSVFLNSYSTGSFNAPESVIQSPTIAARQASGQWSELFVVQNTSAAILSRFHSDGALNVLNNYSGTMLGAPSALIADGTTLGTELVTNGAFTGSATGWTLGAAWTYNSNAVDKNADGTNTLSQAVTITPGKVYVVTFTISNWTAPVQVLDYAPVATGSGYAVGNTLTLSGGTGATVTVAAINGTGGVTRLNHNIATGGNGYTVGTVATTGGTGTGCTVRIQNLSITFVTPSLGGVTGKNVNGNGTYTQVFRATTTGNLTFTPSNTARFTIDSISVRESTGGDLAVSGGLYLTNSQTPATASSTGTVGQIAWDANYIYICTATNTWKRVAISTW